MAGMGLLFVLFIFFLVGAVSKTLERNKVDFKEDPKGLEVVPRPSALQLPNGGFANEVAGRGTTKATATRSKTRIAPTLSSLSPKNWGRLSPKNWGRAISSLSPTKRTQKAISRWHSLENIDQGSPEPPTEANHAPPYEKGASSPSLWRKASRHYVME